MNSSARSISTLCQNTESSGHPTPASRVAAPPVDHVYRRVVGSADSRCSACSDQPGDTSTLQVMPRDTKSRTRVTPELPSESVIQRTAARSNPAAASESRWSYGM